MTGPGLAAARQEAMDAVTCTQTSTAADAQAYREALLLADSDAIVTYIQTNSVLVPITTDTGSAGSGIITGRVG